MAETSNLSPLLRILSEQEILNEQSVSDIQEEHERTGKPVRSIVVDLELISEDELLEIMAGYLGTTVINLPAVDIPPDVVHTISASIAKMYNVVPVEATEDSVKLATFNLISPETMDELMFALTRDVSFVLAREGDVKACINQFYSDESDSVNDMLAALETDIDKVDEGVDVSEEVDERGIEEAAGSTPVIRFVNLVLYQAVNDRASDIHFEPFEKEFKIRYRVDGALYEMAPPPKRLALPIISRIKVMSGLNIAERRLPQDGRIQISIGGRLIDLRVSTLPTQFGESVVLRVLDRSVVSLELENLGMPEDVYEGFSRAITNPNGIIVVTGPTGSGKTTTLYSGLRKINTLDKKLLTAEEPVEYDIEGIIQVPVDEAVGNTFANILRYFLRQDPDVMMVGEIRDVETATIAIQASLTGHLVFTTLHTNDAAGAITRLIDMGVEPYLISSTLETVLGQRLVRTICRECRRYYEPDDNILQSLALTREEIGDRQFAYGAGCANCNDTGYHGRRGIYEFMPMSEGIRELINQSQPTLVMRNKAVELGMRTLREDGIRNILEGHTTVEEVLKYT
jgi:type IV pilus assembly protein PilB